MKYLFRFAIGFMIANNSNSPDCPLFSLSPPPLSHSSSSLPGILSIAISDQHSSLVALLITSFFRTFFFDCLVSKAKNLFEGVLGGGERVTKTAGNGDCCAGSFDARHDLSENVQRYVNRQVYTLYGVTSVQRVSFPFSHHSDHMRTFWVLFSFCFVAILAVLNMIFFRIVRSTFAGEFVLKNTFFPTKNYTLWWLISILLHPLLPMNNYTLPREATAVISQLCSPNLLVSGLLPLIILIIYTIIGAWIFWMIEGGNEREMLIEQQKERDDLIRVREQKKKSLGKWWDWLLQRTVYKINQLQIKRQRKLMTADEEYNRTAKVLTTFQETLGIVPPDLEKDVHWTYLGSIFYCMTVYTTIGELHWSGKWDFYKSTKKNSNFFQDMETSCLEQHGEDLQQSSTPSSEFHSQCSACTALVPCSPRSASSYGSCSWSPRARLTRTWVRKWVENHWFSTKPLFSDLGGCW